MRQNADGRLYQSQTSQLVLTTPEGFFFPLNTRSDFKSEFGAEGKTHNNTDGSIGGWTADPVKTSASMKVRLDEMYRLEDAWAAFDPTTPLLQQVFNFTLTHGNSLATLRKDSGAIKFQKLTRDLPAGSDPLYCDHPLLLLDFQSNGKPPLVYPA